MKFFYSLLFVVFVTAWQTAIATETEPNNTAAQANTLALNGSNTGKINPQGDVDWWKVTTTADGKLNVTLVPTGKFTWIYLYDANGTTLLDSSNSNSSFTKSTDGLAAGLYYIKVKTKVATDTVSYTISNTLTVATPANDAEPNNSSLQAVTFALNSTKTGHLGFYNSNKRDTADWYKITTTADGLLKLKFTPATGSSINAYLYDNNATTILRSAVITSAFNISADGLAAGTYYVKLKCTNSAQFTTYTVTDSLYSPAQANDVEPNDTKALALALSPNSTKTGHAGYYYNNKRDTTDWYKITTTADGLLKLKLTPANGSSINAYLYDNNGTTLLGSGAAGSTFYISSDGLAAGTYYVKLNCTNSAQFTAYTLTDSLYSPAQANDAEPNDTKAQALALTLNSSKTGHAGYYYNNKRDTTDWYKITTTSNKYLRLKITPANGQAVSVTLYANNGTSYINSGTGSTAFNINTDGLLPDTYYVKLNCQSTTGFAPYTLTDSVYTPVSDTLTLPVNFGTKYKLKVPGDVNWWRLKTTNDGKISLTLNPLAGKYVWIYLYDRNGTTLLNSTNSNSKFTLTTDGLAAGTYLVKVNSYYATDTTSYTLADTLTVPAQANDVEPNNTKAQALTLNLNSTKTGHSGYYYNNYRDSSDWYKVTTTADGLLQLKLTPANGSYIWAYLYDNDGTTLLASDNSNTTFKINRDGLATGTYYVKVNCYYNTQFTPYTLTDSLYLPAQANDAEPNDTKAQALTLNLNSTKTGHSGYYYNNKRDSSDWYKITTTADGHLKLKLTPANGSYIWAYLYDNNGTTVLNSGNSNVPFAINTDGLATGTYYVKVNCYYNTQFTPYTLTDSLYLPAQANDTEPNGTKAQALILSQNSTKTGHIGYYYNNKRDTADWYKITTTADGYLRLKLTPANGTYIWAYLYDNNGTAVLNSGNSNVLFNVNTDGLAAGTYYVKVNCYYDGQFTPYTLTDSLTTYSYANDAEPNKRAYQALSLPANSTVNGHINFYYNQVRDSVDWWKLNYTGTGNLNFTFNLATRKGDGSIPYVWFYVYKDTLAAPIYSNYFSTASNAINLTSLTKTNYYIKIIPYYQNDFDAYAIVNSFTPASPAPPEASSLIVSNKPGDKLLAAEEVSVYPNPASTQFRVQLNSSTGNAVSLTLKDAKGKQVWSQANTARLLKTGGLNVNVSSLPSGIYFLSITDEHNKTITKKIIVTR